MLLQQTAILNPLKIISAARGCGMVSLSNSDEEPTPYAVIPQPIGMYASVLILAASRTNLILFALASAFAFGIRPWIGRRRAWVDVAQGVEPGARPETRHIGDVGSVPAFGPAPKLVGESRHCSPT